MTLELILLVSFMGMIFVSTLGDPDEGLRAQFSTSGASLAVRMEKKMTTGHCFQVPVGGGTPCANVLWRGTR